MNPANTASSRWLSDALDELRPICQAVDPVPLEALVAELLAARLVVTYGVGREGLMMRALCMRLMHAGIDAHVAGDMATPPVAHGDLLIVSAGPGDFSTVLALQGVARDAGARIAVLTANPQGHAARLADLVVHVPARTMANDLHAPGILQMGSAFEALEFLLTDFLAIRVRQSRGESAERMRSRHTNLE
jgi:6-phospho-3-hexuloisomerase